MRGVVDGDGKDGEVVFFLYWGKKGAQTVTFGSVEQQNLTVAKIK